MNDRQGSLRPKPRPRSCRPAAEAALVEKDEFAAAAPVTALWVVHGCVEGHYLRRERGILFLAV